MTIADVKLAGDMTRLELNNARLREQVRLLREALDVQQKLSRDLRGRAFVGDRTNRHADPLIQRANLADKMATQALTATARFAGQETAK